MKKWLVVLLFCCFLGIGRAEVSALSKKYIFNSWSGNAVAHIPNAVKTPIIDGRETPGEWTDAVQLAGFMRDGKMIPEQEGVVAFKRDWRFFYILVKTTTPNNDPGGGLVSQVTERDGGVYSDDSVELMFAPRNKTDRVYHLIFNANNAVFDRIVKLDTNSSDSSWNLTGYKVESKAESGWWTFEIALPLENIGSAPNGILFNVARNWSGVGPSALNDTRKHVDVKKMILGVYPRKAPVVRVEGLGTPESGSWNVRMTAVNPLAEKLILAGGFWSYSWPVVNGKVQRQQKVYFLKEQEVLPGQTVRFDWQKEVGSHIHFFSWALYDPKTKNVLFSRLVTSKKSVFTGRRPVTELLNIPGVCSGFYRHYPSYDKAVVELTPLASANGAAVILQAGNQTYQAKRDGRRLIYEVLLTGKNCTVHYLVQKDGKKLAQGVLFRIVKKNFSWENNQLGRDRVVVPPFIPMQKNSAAGLKTLRCQYRFAANGLPESIQADGREILSRPAFMELVADGRKVAFRNTECAVKLAKDGIDAVTSCAVAAGDIKIQSSIHSEYDNFNRHRYVLSGLQGKKISRWTLYFPLKSSEAVYFHAVANTIRSNPAGRIPSGSGVVWDGSRLDRSVSFGLEIVHPAFVPYIWLGGVERGLSWFADTSFGMKLDRKKPAARLVRTGAEVVLEIDLVNRPVVLKDGHEVEFGTQATPVKPVDSRLRNMTFDAYGKGVQSQPNAQCISEHIIGFPFRWAKVPYQEKFSLMEKFARASEEGRHIDFTGIYNEYMAECGPGMRRMYMESGQSQKDADQYEKLRRVFLQINFGPQFRKASLPYKYSDPRLAFTPDKTVEYFKCEWFNPAAQGYEAAMRTTMTPSYRDYIVYGYAQEFRHGMRGCYLDDTFLMPEINPYTVGKIDYEGERHCEVGIYAMREVVKRIAVLQHLAGHSPRMLQVHMTNAQIIPAFSFATSQLSWESDFGEKPLQQRYSIDMILTESTGLQIGNAPLALGGIIRRTTEVGKWQKKFRELTRTLLAMTMPHGVGIWLRASPVCASRDVVLETMDCLGKFGIAEKDCVFEPYFCRAKPLREISGEGLMISTYTRRNSRLLVIGNRDGKMKRFKFNPACCASAVDAENGCVLKADDWQVKPYDFRLVKISLK